MAGGLSAKHRTSGRGAGAKGPASSGCASAAGARAARTASSPWTRGAPCHALGAAAPPHPAPPCKGSRRSAATSAAVPAPRECPTITTGHVGCSARSSTKGARTESSTERAACSMPACTEPRTRNRPSALGTLNGLASARRSVSTSAGECVPRTVATIHFAARSRATKWAGQAAVALHLAIRTSRLARPVTAHRASRWAPAST
mmetsp:Transcript_25920/g.70067  ORF Transcript_25920/g.70067 Transcript_25920/m.70067 type:complete len:203 (-) Transcript_25920:938-1546(-)